MAVALSQFDQDLNQFIEIGLYTAADSQTTVLQIVERGTYAISIQPIITTQTKFSSLGISKQKLQTEPLLRSHCFHGVYTYLISSINERDAPRNGGMAPMFAMAAMGKENRVRIMESLDDMRDLREFQTCHHQQLPQHFPISDEGFELQYAFKISTAGR